MATINELFQDLKQKDEKLAGKISEKGISTIDADEVLQFSRECASNYDDLWKAELFGEAEQLRNMANYWAQIYENITGIEEVPKIPRYKSETN